MSAWWLAAVAVTVYVIALSLIARWLVGAPVGAVRTVLTGTVGFFVIVPLTALAVGTFGIVDEARLARGDVPPSYLFVFAVGALWVVALGAAFLAGLEHLWPTHRSAGLLVRLRAGRDRARRALRYVQIVRIAVRHGLGPLLRGAVIRPDELGPPLVAALSEAGVIFVKLGQVLAARRDIVPEALADALSTLQTDVPAEPWSRVVTTVEAELAHPMHAVFARIEPSPIAAASIGQVHAATLLSGEQVVVKVQRPGARAQVDVDTDIVLRLCRRLEHRSESARRIGATRLAQELAQSLHDELDYRAEQRNLDLMRRAASRSGTGIRIPRSHPELSTGRVLTMERLSGEPLAAGRPLREASAHRRRQVAIRLLDGVLHQIFVDGVFHADLHAGNIMIDADGALGMIDLGSVACVDRQQRELLRAFLWSFHTEDAPSAVVAIRHLTVGDPLPDEKALERDVGELFTIGAIERDTAQITERLLRIFHRHGLAVPGNLAAAVRTMASLQEAIRALDHTAEYADLLLDRVHRATSQLQSPRRLAHETAGQMLTLSQFIRRLPHTLDALVESSSRRPREDAERERARRVRRFRSAIAAIGCIVALLAGGGALLLALRDGGPVLEPGIPVLPLWGAAIGSVSVIIGTRSLIALSRLADDER